MILYHGLLAKRVIPDLATNSRDINIWSRLKSEEIGKVRQEWLRHGFNVSRRLDVSQMITCFMQAARDLVNPEELTLVCPITKECIGDESAKYKLWLQVTSNL